MATTTLSGECVCVCAGGLFPSSFSRALLTHTHTHTHTHHRLLGVCLARAPFHIITELAELGNLRDFLRESRGTQTMTQSVTLRELMSYMEHTARGLQYLLSQGIVHKMLTAKSVLLSAQHVCKVSDYGRDPFA